MSAELNKSFAAENAPTPESWGGTEPIACRAPVPVWLIILFGAVFYGGQIYLDHAAGGFDPHVYEPYRDHATLKANQPIIVGDPYVRGERVYHDVAKCVACHQPSGLGRPGQFPPLAGSEWVLAEGPNRIIRVVLHGFNGPVDVDGQSFSGAMVPFRDVLEDKDVAAVLMFIRQNKAWGNNASAVKVGDVKAIREASQGRDLPWTAAELQNIPEKD
jgi:mono/diheme cytochrome c family protein